MQTRHIFEPPDCVGARGDHLLDYGEEEWPRANKRVNIMLLVNIHMRTKQVWNL
jgi:hypothetical protein